MQLPLGGSLKTFTHTYKHLNEGAGVAAQRLHTYAQINTRTLRQLLLRCAAALHQPCPQGPMSQPQLWQKAEGDKQGCGGRMGGRSGADGGAVGYPPFSVMIWGTSLAAGEMHWI